MHVLTYFLEYRWNDNLVFRTFAVFLGVLGLSGAVGILTGPYWCCLRGYPRKGQLMSLAHRDEGCFLGKIASCVW